MLRRDYYGYKKEIGYREEGKKRFGS